MWLILGLFLIAADAPATAPTSAPVYRATVPPGHVVVKAQGQTVYCEPAEQAWVQSALAEITATTRPSTMPADLLTRLTDKRKAIVTDLTSRLALPDSKPIDEFLDQKLIPRIERFRDLSVPTIYLVTTRDKLKTLLKNGWQEPRLRYNRATDDIVVDDTVNLSIERTLDDVVVPTPYLPESSEADRKALLGRAIRISEGNFLFSIATRAQISTQLGFAELIDTTAFKSISDKPDQEWFAGGVATVLSSRCLSEINGMDFESLYRDLTGENPRNPVKSASIDLLHPTSIKDLRPQYVPLYQLAYRRKSTMVIHDWLAKAPPDALPKTIEALRKSPPADGAALLQLIQQTSGISLAEEVKPK